MSADIEKLAVFDSRIVQSRPRYAVEKGALSLTNAPFNAISATSSQHTYNIYVPSENVFVDRALEWTSTATMSSVITPSGTLANWAIGFPIVVPGVDFALTAFPLNSLCSTMTATINDTTSVINSQDVLKEVLRLTDYKKNRLQRTCPTMLDKYQCYDDAYGLPNCPLNGYGTAIDYDGVQNGAFGQIVFTDSGGQALVEGLYYVNGVLTTTAQTGAAAGAIPAAAIVGCYRCSNGLPSLVASTAGGAAVDCAGPFTIFYQWTSTEKLVLSPFTFSDVHEWDTGLFGINNIQLIMNFQAPTRIVRHTGVRWNQGVATYGAGGASPQSYATLTATQFATASPFQRSVVNVQFLTPSLDVPLPPKSVVPYMEFPRYLTTSSATINAGVALQIQSQTITLPQIPDLLIVYVKGLLPSGSGSTNGINDTNFGDFYLPIASRSYGGVANPLSVNFDNFSGLLSSHTAEQLYAMSVKNGLEQDWLSWTGSAFSGQNAYAAVASASGTGVGWGGFGSQLAGSNPPSAATGAQKVPLTGGILVLKPSQDITLQTGQAPSLVGNFTLQFNLTVFNNTGLDGVVPQLFVITANSGFFESIRGSSRIIKGVLSEQDIIGAPLAPTATRQELCRYVGGSGLMSSLGNILSKVKGPALDLLKQAGLAAGKELLSHGTAYAKKKFGFGDGASGGAMSGCGDGMSGGMMSGGRARGRKGLDARLM
jgi:hypothetical protein